MNIPFQKKYSLSKQYDDHERGTPTPLNPPRIHPYFFNPFLQDIHRMNNKKHLSFIEMLS